MPSHTLRSTYLYTSAHMHALLPCTLQQMVTGHSPWSALRFRSLVNLAIGMEHHRLPPVPSCLSDDLQQLLISCFTWEPFDRPTARELLFHDFCRAVHCQECVGSLCVTTMATMVLAATIVAAVAATAGAAVIAVTAVWTLRLTAVTAATAVGAALSSLHRLTGHTVHQRHC
jgi:hypothetical protein